VDQVNQTLQVHLNGCLLLGLRRACVAKSTPNAVSKLLTKVNPPMAESPACESHCIRLRPLLKPDCACALRRKARTVPPSLSGSPFSTVRFVDEILRNTGMFCVFLGEGRRTFSAVETCWGREWDSNLRYLFVRTCKRPYFASVRRDSVVGIQFRTPSRQRG
jgi:hypothetical protein